MEELREVNNMNLEEIKELNARYPEESDIFKRLAILYICREHQQIDKKSSERLNFIEDLLNELNQDGKEPQKNLVEVEQEYIADL